MRLSAMVGLLLLCCIAEGLAEKEIPASLAFKKIEIPVEEARQQRLLNVHEYRCTYAWTRPIGQTIMLFAETYKGGRQVGRYELSTGSFSDQAGEVKGTISVAWREDQRQLATINDDGTPWVARARIPENEFVTPELDWLFSAYLFTESFGEARQTPAVNRQETVFPLLGIWGGRTHIIGFEGPLRSTTDFLATAKSSGAETVIIVYLFLGSYHASPNLPMK